jgi:hypothetical protein
MACEARTPSLLHFGECRLPSELEFTREVRGSERNLNAVPVQGRMASSHAILLDIAECRLPSEPEFTREVRGSERRLSAVPVQGSMASEIRTPLLPDFIECERWQHQERARGCAWRLPPLARRAPPPSHSSFSNLPSSDNSPSSARVVGSLGFARLLLLSSARPQAAYTRAFVLVRALLHEPLRSRRPKISVAINSSSSTQAVDVEPSDRC